MICITSRIGVTIRRARALSATRIPIGTPMAIEIATAAVTAPSVSTLDSQSDRTPRARNPSTVITAPPEPPAM